MNFEVFGAGNCEPEVKHTRQQPLLAVPGRLDDLKGAALGSLPTVTPTSLGRAHLLYFILIPGRDEGP